jgi:amino acid exporter
MVDARKPNFIIFASLVVYSRGETPMFNNPIFPTLVAGLALPYALVLAVPGPNFLIVLHASLVSPERSAFATALGIASGASLAAATASCVAVLMPNNKLIEVCGVLIFSFLLLRTAASLIRNPTPVGPSRDAPLAVEKKRGHFGLGLMSAFFNPVTIPFFIGFFLAHPRSSSAQATLAACATVFAMAALWFGLLGFAFVRSASRRGRLCLEGRWSRSGVAFGLLAYAVLALFRLF